MSVLVRLFSLKNLDLAEEVVQASLLDALRVWRTRGLPDNPSAWVRRVAKNKLVDLIRHDRIVLAHAKRIESDSSEPASPVDPVDDAFLDSEIADSQLRMMFVCCDPRLRDDDRVALTLKTLCGFGHDEIARALLTNSETIKKRLQRAKATLAEAGLSLDLPPPAELEARLAAVHRVLYLLFNEGYLSTSADRAIRQDLCDEAIRLTTILADHPRYAQPSTDALLALMLFHAARLESRLTVAGGIILLGEQDRTTWDHSRIDQAEARLDRSARGERISRFHLEAGIALIHCRATSLAATDWTSVIRMYDALIAAIPSPLYQLNRAIAIAERDGPRAGLAAIRDAGLDESLDQHHLLHATMGELSRRLGEHATARSHFAAALDCSPSPSERKLLTQKIESQDSPT